MSWETDYGRATRPRILPGIKEVHWLGFRGRVSDLHENGWQFAEEEIEEPQYRAQCHRIIVRHPTVQAVGMGSFMLDSRFMYEQERIAHQSGYYGPPVIPININMGREVYIAEDPHWYIADVLPRTAEERAWYMGHPPIPRPDRYRGLRQMPLFHQLDLLQQHTKLANGPQVILESATLEDVLNYALSKQKPIQDKLRMDEVRRSRVAAQLLHAA